MTNSKKNRNLESTCKPENGVVVMLNDAFLDLPTSAVPLCPAPNISHAAMIELCELYLPIQNSRPDFVEFRKHKGFDIPFFL